MRRRTLVKGLVAAGLVGFAHRTGAWGAANEVFAVQADTESGNAGGSQPGSAPEVLGRAGPCVPLLDGAQLERMRVGIGFGAVLRDHPAATASADASLAAEAVPYEEPLRRAADRALAAGPFSVMDKTTVAPSGDPHDYYSVGPYWWPNPDTPDGLPYVQRDGEFNPSFRDNTYDFTALDQMTKSVGTLAVAFYLTGDARYAAHAARLIRTWFLDPATCMNPNMRYSQTVPGRPGERGTGIIDGRQLMAVAEAAVLLGATPWSIEDGAQVGSGPPAWSEMDDAALRAWFGALIDWLQKSAAGQAEARAENNHGSWYAAQVAAYALYARQEPLARQMAAERGPALIASQIAPDGRQPRELVRTRPFHYSAFNLEALTALALIGGEVGVDLWRYETPDGRGLRAALDYLVPFATDAAPWPYPDRDFDGRALAPLLARAARVYPDAGYAALVPQAFPDATPLQQLYLRLGVW
ncbi:MAG TPA: alginate lyase family protein [Chloroflexota bacterium]|jgi:hypothetical protein